MKLIQTKAYKNKILKLKLIQTKTYKKNYNNFIKIEDINSRLKKSFNIIYNYHINNKRILFVGTPINVNSKLKKLLKKTNHMFVPESIWVSGILTNQETCLEYLLKKSKSVNNKTSETLFQMKKQSDLIVVLEFFSNKKTIIEAYLAKIPLISLNCDLKILDNSLSYKIPGSFKFKTKKVRDILFYSILGAIFKKPK